MAESTTSSWIIVGIITIIVIIVSLMFFGPTFRNLFNAYLGLGEITEEQQAESEDAFAYFLKQYQECKASQDTNCLCPLGIVLPENAVVKIENNQQLKQTELKLVEGRVDDTILPGIHPTYEGENNPLTELAREKRMILNDIPYLPQDDWKIIESEGKFILDTSFNLHYSPSLFLANGDDCGPCLFSGEDISGIETKPFDPGYLYKVDAERVVLLPEKKVGGTVITITSPGAEELRKLTKCTAGDPRSLVVLNNVIAKIKECSSVEGGSEGNLCSYMGLIENENSVLPTSYSLTLTPGTINLLRANQIVRSAAIPNLNCEFSQGNLQKPLSGIKVDQEVARLDFFKVQDNQLCVRAVDKRTAQQEAIEATRIALES